MSSTVLKNTIPPWVVLVVADKPQFTDLLLGLKVEQPHGVVIHVRGAKMKTVTALFDEVAAAFQFPPHFGESWPALDECLRDLSWLQGTAYVLGILDPGLVLTEAPDDFRAFCEVLEKACAEWGRSVDEGQLWGHPPRPFHVLLQCEDMDLRQVISGYEGGGLEVVAMPLSDVSSLQGPSPSE